MKKTKLIHIGTFGKPLGLKGTIKINMHTSSFNSFKSLDPYLDDKNNKVWNFVYLNIHKGKLVGRLKDYTNRSSVEELIGKKIYTDKNSFTKTKLNQYYVIDLIDCEVRNIKNEILGIIINIDNFGAGDLINIKKSNNKNFYIPFNKENVTTIDIKKKFVIVNPIKGIMD